MATHWKALSNSEYLGAYSLEDQKDIVLTIGTVAREMVTGPDGKKEECIVCHFKENVKPMILNATNCKTISKLLGTPYIENWSGKKIQIGIEKVKAFGDVVDALRVRKTAPKEEAPIPCENCGNTLQSAYGMTVSELAKYTKNQYKQCLCAECAKKMKEKKEKNNG